MNESRLAEQQVCKVCGKPLVFKGYYSNGYPDFVGENWDCPDQCDELVETENV